MTLLHALHAHSAPLVHCLRPHDGVRCVCASRPLRRGSLLLAVPLRYCYFPHASRDALRMRRWNRSALVPEVQQWLSRLSPAALCASSSSSFSYSFSSSSSRPVVLHVSPVEAALATSVALRYFWATGALCCKSLALRLGPTPSRAADLFVRSLPLAQSARRGVEGTYAARGNCGALHMCVEQVARNLRDAVLDAASMDAYRVYDANPAALDEALLAALYVVRARLLRVAVVRGESNDGATSVIAPLVDMMNHSAGDPTGAACVALQRRAVVVRAVRDIAAGEEITLNYRGPDNARKIGEDEADAEDVWEARYLFAAEDAFA